MNKLNSLKGEVSQGVRTLDSSNSLCLVRMHRVALYDSSICKTKKQCQVGMRLDAACHTEKKLMTEAMSLVEMYTVTRQSYSTVSGKYTASSSKAYHQQKKV